MNKILIVKKIEIVSLLEALDELYSMGVAFVNISGTIGEENDAIYLSFSKEYMDEESKDNFENIEASMPDIPNINVKLSDDDINQIV